MKLHPVITNAMMKHAIDADEFFGRSVAPQAVTARLEAIQELSAAGFDNRTIATMVKRNIGTVRYWLCPKIREHRIGYKAGTRTHNDPRWQAAIERGEVVA